MAFIAADFPEKKFKKGFYDRLSHCFGMIAHYSREGFFDTFFTDFPGKLRFLKCLTQWPCYGSPEYTFSDVEPQRPRRFGRWGTWRSTMPGYVASPRRRERAILALLQAKYDGSEASACCRAIVEHELVYARPFAPASAPALPTFSLHCLDRATAPAIVAVPELKGITIVLRRVLQRRN